MARKIAIGNLRGRIQFAQAEKGMGSRGGLPPWGRKFVLYRPSHNKDKKDRIVLVSDKKRN